MGVACAGCGTTAVYRTVLAFGKRGAGIYHLVADHYLCNRKAVAHQASAWLINFNTYPLLWALPVLGVVLPLFTVLFLRLEKGALAFITSSLTITCVILTTAVTMFPFVMPPSTVPGVSLTMWDGDATSSLLTMKVMTIVALIILPIVLAYTSWSYYKMFGRLDKNYIANHKHSLY
ncbi:MAG: cytochrome d ubiquinol oxidase subunit II [Serratia symbiotica]|nr:cytochrome d ubiquinol oxidase subunit II [Serratia symbiotica]